MHLPRENPVAFASSPGSALVQFGGAAANDSTASPREMLRVGLGATDRVLRITPAVAFGRHRCVRERPPFLRGAHACAYVVFHRSCVRLAVEGAAAQLATQQHVSFHNPGESCRAEAAGGDGAVCDWLALSPDFLDEFFFRHPHLRSCAAGARAFAHTLAPLGPAAFVAQRRCFAQLADPRQRMTTANVETIAVQLFAAVAGDAQAHWRRGDVRPSAPRRISRRQRIVDEARAVLAREFARELPLPLLAQKLHCSPAYLSRIFHAVVGMRLNEYRRELRLYAGASLLEDSPEEIGEIAIALGFASHSHFSAAFRKRFGLRPTEFLAGIAR